MPNRTTALVAAAGAALFVVFFVVGFAIQPTDPPDSNDSAVQIIQFAADHRSSLLVGDFLFALAGIPFVILIAALHRLIRRAEGPDGWLSTAALVGAVASGAAFTAGASLLATLAYRPVQAPGVARMLMDAGFITLNFSGILLGVFIAAVSAAALLHRVVPVWVGWVGVPIAAAQVVAGGALARGDGVLSPQGAIPLIAAGTVAIWTLLLAIGLVLVSRTSTLTQ